MDDLIRRSDTLRMFPSDMESPLRHFTGIRAALENVPAVDAVPVVRCKDCIHYKKPHVLMPGGQEKSYEEMPQEAFGGLDDIYVTMEYGINVGGKCMLDCGRGYLDDKSVFRSPNDFCSYGCKDTNAK